MARLGEPGGLMKVDEVSQMRCLWEIRVTPEAPEVGGGARRDESSS
jgi:hypothetical protein